MAMTESWFGDTMETSYSSTLQFSDSSLWTDDHSSTYDSDDPAWKMLELCNLRDTFFARIYITRGTQSCRTKYKVILHRKSLGISYGESPTIAVRITIEQDNDIIFQERNFDERWFVEMGYADLVELAKDEGYQGHLIPESLTSKLFQEEKGLVLNVELQITAGDDPKTADTFPRKVLFSLAQKLEQPICADVEFIFPPEADGTTKRLYAISTVLENRSSYFSRKGRLEVKSEIALANGDRKFLQAPRRLVKIPDDFDLFHIILFYLYTDRICFTTTPEKQFDIPVTDNAEGIYAIAHRLMLDSLVSKAIKFLNHTCTSRNITSRSFGIVALSHEPIVEVYDAFFMKNWDAVVQTKEFEEFFKEMENDAEEYIRINTKLRDMIRSRIGTNQSKS